jgi:hypothetical protein
MALELTNPRNRIAQTLVFSWRGRNYDWKIKPDALIDAGGKAYRHIFPDIMESSALCQERDKRLMVGEKNKLNYDQPVADITGIGLETTSADVLAGRMLNRLFRAQDSGVLEIMRKMENPAIRKPGAPKIPKDGIRLASIIALGRAAYYESIFSGAIPEESIISLLPNSLHPQYRVETVRFARALQELAAQGRESLALTRPTIDEVADPGQFFERIMDIPEMSGIFSRG